MTFFEAVKSGLNFKRPHWRAQMIARDVEHNDIYCCEIRRKVFWVSTGDLVDSFSSETVLAKDFITIPEKVTCETNGYDRGRVFMPREIRNFIEQNEGSKMRITCEIV